MSIKSHVVLIQAFTVLTFVTYAYCYCHRPGFICMNRGNCTEDRSTCVCDRNWGGYDCRAPKEYLGCYRRCSNHGTCVLRNYCYCDFGYYGSNCEKKNETITCNMFSMDVKMAVPGKRAISLRGADDCPLKKVRGTPNELVYSRSFPMAPTPGSPCEGYVRKHHAPGVFSYTLAMTVQRRKQMFSPLDWITEFTCNYERSANGSSKPKEDFKLFEVDILDYMTQLIPNGGKTTMSKEFSLVFFSNKTDFEVLVVELHMYNVWTGEKMFDLIMDGCRTYHGKKYLINDQIVGEHLRYEGPTVQGTFVHFLPLNDAYELYFDYKVRLCKGQCTKPICESKVIPETRPGVRLILE